MLALLYFISVINCISAFISIYLHHYYLSVVLFCICALIIIFSIDFKKVRQDINKQYCEKQ